MSEAVEATGGLRSWPATDVGRVRDHNEDSFLVDKKLNLYIVADGMGGHAAGEVASQMASRTVRDAIAAERDALLEFEQGHGGTTRKDLLRLLEASVQQACSTVHNEGVKDESKRGMGTTLDAFLVIGSRGFIAHVGDARIYLYRQGSVHQLTEDHSLINELLKRGRLTREQIDKVQYKNAVTRAVGVYESVEVDMLDFDVLPGRPLPALLRWSPRLSRGERAPASSSRTIPGGASSPSTSSTSPTSGAARTTSRRSSSAFRTTSRASTSSPAR